MQCIVVKSDEFVAPYIFPLNPGYVAARSLRSLRSNQMANISNIHFANLHVEVQRLTSIPNDIVCLRKVNF